jgi:membrane protein
MSAALEKTKGIKGALNDFLWSEQEKPLPLEWTRTLMVALWKFRSDRGPLRASALAFSTVLSIVPLLSLAFAVLKGLGIQQRLEPIIIEHFAKAHQEIATKIIEYVDRTQMTGLGVAGLITLALTAIAVIGNIEKSFNDIWGVTQGRSAMRRFTDYTTIMVLCPLLIILSASIATTGQVQKYLGGLGAVEGAVEVALPIIYSISPYFIKCAAFAAAYLVLPNRRVGMKAALSGAMVAAIFWQATEWTYINFQIGVAKYNAIYGTMAQLPAFLVWVYVGWCIVLVGAELACVVELPGRGRYLRGGEELWTPRMGAALKILKRLSANFTQGHPPLTVVELIEDAGLHPVEGRRLVDVLTKAGLTTATCEEDAALIPAISPESTTMGEVIRRIVAPDLASDEIEVTLLEKMSETFGDTTWAKWAAS